MKLFQPDPAQRQPEKPETRDLYLVLLGILLLLLISSVLSAAGVTHEGPVPWYYWPLLLFFIGVMAYKLWGRRFSPPVQVAVFALSSLALLAVLILMLTESSALSNGRLAFQGCAVIVFLADSLRDLGLAVRAWRDSRRQTPPAV